MCIDMNPRASIEKWFCLAICMATKSSELPHLPLTWATSQPRFGPSSALALVDTSSGEAKSQNANLQIQSQTPALPSPSSFL